jgi:hypothetical protein
VAGSPKVHYNFESGKNLTYVKASEHEGGRHVYKQKGGNNNRNKVMIIIIII